MKRFCKRCEADAPHDVLIDSRDKWTCRCCLTQTPRVVRKPSAAKVAKQQRYADIARSLGYE